jgi:hypothetical protein
MPAAIVSEVAGAGWLGRPGLSASAAAVAGERPVCGEPVRPGWCPWVCSAGLPCGAEVAQ